MTNDFKSFELSLFEYELETYRWEEEIKLGTRSRIQIMQIS